MTDPNEWPYRPKSFVEHRAEVVADLVSRVAGQLNVGAVEVSVGDVPGLRIEPRKVNGQPDHRRLCVMLDEQIVLEFDPRVVSSNEALRMASLRLEPRR